MDKGYIYFSSNEGKTYLWFRGSVSAYTKMVRDQKRVRFEYSSPLRFVVLSQEMTKEDIATLYPDWGVASCYPPCPAATEYCRKVSDEAN